MREKSDYSKNFVNPIIPKGYRYVCGKWNNGFVIERNTDESQFVWIPVGSLKSNGIFSSKKTLEKLGRRYDFNKSFAYLIDNEVLEEKNGLKEQLDSVKKYGGFYISRFNISKNENGKPQSVKGYFPWVNISYIQAREISILFESDEVVKSHLTYGAEYDTVIEWILESNARSVPSLMIDSREWGNFLESIDAPRCLTVTGAKEKYCTNNIYDLAGNVCEITQENYKETGLTCYIRGGDFKDSKNNSYVMLMRPFRKNDKFSSVGFRIVLCIK